jgi:hypothetical protein
MANETQTVTDGIFIAGRILNVEEKRGTSKAGQPYFMLGYMVLCGTKVVKVQQTQSDSAPVHKAGERVMIDIEPSFRDNGVIICSGNVVKIS